LIFGNKNQAKITKFYNVRKMEAQNNEEKELK